MPMIARLSAYTAYGVHDYNVFMHMLKVIFHLNGWTGFMVYPSLMKVSEVVEGVLLVTTNVAGSPSLILWGLIQGFCLHFKVCD